MRLTQIQQILEIEKCTSISQAARNMYISQPALSALLNEFENEIGVQLFTRTKTGIQPTQNGYFILESMKKIMHEVDYIQTYAANEEDLSGDCSFVIGASYEFLYAEIIQRFKTRFPKAHFNSINEVVLTVEDAISKGMVDIAIQSIHTEGSDTVAIQTNDKYKNLAFLPLKNCHTFAVMNSSHIRSKQEYINLSELVSEQLVLGKQFNIDTFNEKLSLEKYPIYNIDRMTMLQLLKQNIAIYLDASPLTLEQYKMNYSDYCVLPVVNNFPNTIPSTILEWPVYFIYRKNQNSRLQQLFIEEIKHLLQNKNLIAE